MNNDLDIHVLVLGVMYFEALYVEVMPFEAMYFEVMQFESMHCIFIYAHQ